MRGLTTCRGSRARSLARLLAQSDRTFGLWLPAISGAIAGAVPVSLFGEADPVGAIALFLWGTVGAMGGAVFWAYRPVIETATVPDETGISAYLHTLGLSRWRGALTRARLGADRVLAGVVVGGVSGLLSGSVAGAYGAGWSIGPARGPGITTVIGAASLCIATWALAALSGLLVRRTATAMLLWRANLVAVLTVIMSAAWFEPARHLLAVFPLAGLWPTPPSSEAGVLAGLNLSIAGRLVILSTWGALGSALLWRRSTRLSLLPVEH